MKKLRFIKWALEYHYNSEEPENFCKEEIAKFLCHDEMGVLSFEERTSMGTCFNISLIKLSHFNAFDGEGNSRENVNQKPKEETLNVENILSVFNMRTTTKISWVSIFEKDISHSEICDTIEIKKSMKPHYRVFDGLLVVSHKEKIG